MFAVENRCSRASEPLTCCGVRLLTMWRVKAGADYQIPASHNRHGWRKMIRETGKNLVMVRTDGGRGEIVTKSGKQVLVRNSIYLFDILSLEGYRTLGRRWNFWWIEFTPEEPLPLPLHTVLQSPTALRESSRCEEVFEKLESDCRDQQHLAAAIWQNLTYEWLASAAAPEVESDPTSVALDKLIEAIKRKPGRRWSSAEMAEVCGLSSLAMRKECLRTLGVTPIQYRLQIRLSYAYETLRRGDISVALVADILGFCDPYHFSKAFKKQFGFCPSVAHLHQR